jgi:hypothetical protein
VQFGQRQHGAAIHQSFPARPRSSVNHVDIVGRGLPAAGDALH